jgi:hypothetical protein
MNGWEMQQLMQKYPNGKQWKRPFALEGWFWLSLRQKFACSPTLATQNRTPKEVKDSKTIQYFGLNKLVEIVETIMMYTLPSIGIVTLLVMLICLLRKKRLIR